MITNRNQFKCAQHHITVIVLASSGRACRTWSGQKQTFRRQDFIFISAVWRFAHTHPCANMASRPCARILHSDIARRCFCMRIICVHVPSTFSRVKQLVFFSLYLALDVLEMWYCSLTPHMHFASSVASPTLFLHIIILISPSRYACCPCFRPCFTLGSSQLL